MARAVIYYYRGSVGRLYLVFAYPKNEAGNLSDAGKAMMRKIVAAIEKEK